MGGSGTIPFPSDTPIFSKSNLLVMFPEIASEEYQSGIDRETTDRKMLDSKSKLFYRGKLDTDLPTLQERFYNEFYDVIEKYSGCALTKSDDKLVAISGIARIMPRESVKDEYLAGLWLRTLPESLVWWSYAHLLPTHSYRVPSWSWASVDGRLGIQTYLGLDPICKVNDYSIKLTNPTDPFGQVKGGWIKLAGPLRTIKISYDFEKKPSTMEYFGSEPQYLPCIGRGPDPTVTELHCIPVADNVSKFNSILLQPTGRAKGEFRRWGSDCGT
jgi:hypothetical protein